MWKTIGILKKQSPKSPIIGSRAWLRRYELHCMSKSGKTGIGGERQYVDLQQSHINYRYIKQNRDTVNVEKENDKAIRLMSSHSPKWKLQIKQIMNETNNIQDYT